MPHYFTVEIICCVSCACIFCQPVTQSFVIHNYYMVDFIAYVDIMSSYMKEEGFVFILLILKVHVLCYPLWARGSIAHM